MRFSCDDEPQLPYVWVSAWLSCHKLCLQPTRRDLSKIEQPWWPEGRRKLLLLWRGLRHTQEESVSFVEGKVWRFSWREKRMLTPYAVQFDEWSRGQRQVTRSIYRTSVEFRPRLIVMSHVQGLAHVTTCSPRQTLFLTAELCNWLPITIKWFDEQSIRHPEHIWRFSTVSHRDCE